jgi:hypothetical protein
MPFSAEEQKLYDWIKGSLPSWFFQRARAEEELGALVKTFDLARQQVAFYRSQGMIGTATGVVATDPDYLAQHAKDRATDRAAAESDPALRERLRRFEDALTRGALLALIDAMLDAAGIASNAFGLVELRRDRAFMATRTEVTGAGAGPDAFTKVGTTMTLTLAAAPWQAWMNGRTLTLAGSTSAANNGDFVITGFVGDVGVQYTNAAGVAETFPGTWKVNKDNRKDAYLSRGYRMSGKGAAAGIVAILPYPTDEGLRLAVHEALRQRKAAGISHQTERRLVP